MSARWGQSDEGVYGSGRPPRIIAHAQRARTVCSARPAVCARPHPRPLRPAVTMHMYTRAHPLIYKRNFALVYCPLRSV